MKKEAHTYRWLMARTRTGERRIERLTWKRLAAIYFASTPNTPVRRAIDAEARRLGYEPKMILMIHK